MSPIFHDIQVLEMNPSHCKIMQNVLLDCFEILENMFFERLLIWALLISANAKNLLLLGS